MNDRQQGSTSHPMTFLMISSTDHILGALGLLESMAVTISKNGAAFAAAAGSVSEVGSGWYALAGDAGDRDTLGEFKLHATATGADPADRDYVITPYDPFNGASLGLSNLANAVPATSDITSAVLGVGVPGAFSAGTAGAILGTLGPDAGFPAAAVSSASSTTQFVIACDQSVTAANFTGWTVDFGGQLAAPSYGTIASATQVDGTRLTITLASALSATPMTAMTVALAPPPSVAGDAQGRVTLAPGGLDAITATEPDTGTNGPVNTWNFRQLLRWGVMCVANASRSLSAGSGAIVVKKLGGSTSTTQAIIDDGSGNETLGSPT